MATDRTVGSGGDDIDLSTWEEVVEDLAGPHTATLIADIVDTLAFSSWGGGGAAVIIKGDLAGNTKRRITSDGGGSALTLITCASGGMTSLTLEDLYLDCTGMANYKYGIYLTTGLVSCTVRRCTIFQPSANCRCINTNSASIYTTGTYDNCIFDLNGTGHRHLQFEEADQENTSTFRNCLFTGAANRQASLADSDNIIVNYYNCVSFSNSGTDFSPGGANTDTNTTNCVSEDSTAATGHDSTSGSVEGKTALSSYFRDEDSDFRLLQNDFNNWGINGDSDYTPALDYASVSRVNNDIGPYEHIATASGRSSDLTVAMNMARSLDEHPY